MIVFALLSNSNLLGVYNSMKQLSKGVDYWMKVYPRNLLSYEERNMNYSLEANSWDWCYVPLNTRVKRLTKGGASFIPMNKYWGHNLIELNLRGIKTHREII